MFRFIKKDKYFCWSNNQLGIVFSDGEFQAKDEFMYVNGPEDILYFYYSVAATKKTGNCYNEISSAVTHDFPQILSLIDILRWMLENVDEVPLNEYQSVFLPDRKHYSYSIQTDDWMYEDFYKLTRHVFEFDDGRQTTSFDLYFGASAEGLGSLNTAGINIFNLCEDEIKELLKTAESFVDYCISIHNERIGERNQKDVDSYSIRHGKLYQIKDNCIENIFEVGSENLEIICMDGTVKDKNYTSKCYAGCKINKIVDDSIEVLYDYLETRTGDFVKMTEPIVIKINTILDVFNNVSEPELSYGEKEIADDFFKILTKEELDEFIKSEDDDKLYDRWAEAICNRTWMCRDEHKYFIPKLHKGGVEAVERNIEYVIRLIKKKAKDCQ